MYEENENIIPFQNLPLVWIWLHKTFKWNEREIRGLCFLALELIRWLFLVFFAKIFNLDGQQFIVKLKISITVTITTALKDTASPRKSPGATPRKCSLCLSFFFYCIRTPYTMSANKWDYVLFMAHSRVFAQNI